MSVLLLSLAACLRSDPEAAPTTTASDALVVFDTGPFIDTGGGPIPPTGPILTSTVGTVTAIQAEPTFCWATRLAAGTSIAVDVVGLASGRRAPFATLSGSNQATSIFREGQRLIVTAAAPGAGSLRFVVDARTGAVQSGGTTPSLSLHTAGGTYVGETSVTPQVDWYADRGAVRAGLGQRVTMWSAIVWGNGDRLYPAAWFATDTVDLYDPVAMTLTRSVQLLGFDDWITDLQLEGDRLYMLDDGRSAFANGQLLGVFDANTGAHLRSVEFPVTVNYTAFVCRSAP